MSRFGICFNSLLALLGVLRPFVEDGRGFIFRGI